MLRLRRLRRFAARCSALCAGYMPARWTAPALAVAGRCALLCARVVGVMARCGFGVIACSGGLVTAQRRAVCMRMPETGRVPQRVGCDVIGPGVGSNLIIGAVLSVRWSHEKIYIL